MIFLFFILLFKNVLLLCFTHDICFHWKTYSSQCHLCPEHFCFQGFIYDLKHFLSPKKNILFLFCFFKGKKSPRNVFLLLRYLVYLFFEMKMFSPPGKKKSPDYFFTSFWREIHEYPRLQQQTAASLLRTLPGNKFHLQNQPADRIQDNHILTCRTKTVKALWTVSVAGCVQVRGSEGRCLARGHFDQTRRKREKFI